LNPGKGGGYLIDLSSSFSSSLLPQRWLMPSFWIRREGVKV